MLLNRSTNHSRFTKREIATPKMSVLSCHSKKRKPEHVKSDGQTLNMVQKTKQMFFAIEK